MEQFNANRMYFPQCAMHSMNGGCNAAGQMNGFAVAMSYTPWQQWERTYEPSAALKRGTIFPSLDLPFLGGGCRK